MTVLAASSNGTLKTKVIAFLLCLVVILGSAGTLTFFKQHYDLKLAALTESVETLQEQLRLQGGGGAAAPDPVYANGLSVPDIARKAGASVVGIKITAQVKAQSGWFGPQIYQQVSEGSGIIYNSDGYIVTNYHVVGDYATSEGSLIEVFLTDGRSAIARYIGGDSENDLAVIQIDLPDLPVAQFGSSAGLHSGEFAMAIGNPLGMELAGSVTVGVISGIERKVEKENTADSLIQTDAAINPGNSGGALVNGRAEVIGINTLKIASQGVEGIGFAIPIDYARPIIDSVISYGYVKGRPFIGISYTEINERTAQQYSVPRGILITDVVDGGAADRAGLQANDIITSIDDIETTDMSAIKNILKKYRAGDEVTVTYYRYQERQTKTTKMTFDERR